MPKSVVITGSTRGIGRGLAQEMLKLGCEVVVNGRSPGAVAEAARELGEEHEASRVIGVPCDMTKPEQVRELMRAGREAFGKIDVWINNAGVDTPNLPVWELDDEDLRRVVDANLTGVLYGLKVPIAAMIEQGHGQVWLMEGFGSGGQIRTGITPYAATKRAVRYLGKAMAAETAGTNVQVCTVSPGILVTDLLIGDYDYASDDWASAKRIFNILGDKVETATPWLAQKILATDKSGSHVAWLSRRKAFARFAFAPFRSRDLFAGMDLAND